ncbi:hypothetical protein ACLKA6_013460 [Drosophila palustris]
MAEHDVCRERSQPSVATLQKGKKGGREDGWNGCWKGDQLGAQPVGIARDKGVAWPQSGMRRGSAGGGNDDDTKSSSNDDCDDDDGDGDDDAGSVCRH